MLEVLLNANSPAHLVALKHGVTRRIRPKCLYSATSTITKMARRDANLLVELARVTSTTGLTLESQHCVTELRVRNVECAHAYVDVDHQLLEYRAYRGVKSLPRFQTCAKWKRLFWGTEGRGRNEVSIPAERHSGVRGMRGCDKIESGDYRQRIVAYIISLKITKESLV